VTEIKATQIYVITPLAQLCAEQHAALVRNGVSLREALRIHNNQTIEIDGLRELVEHLQEELRKLEDERKDKTA
jgi:type II secretory pathway component PulF